MLILKMILYVNNDTITFTVDKNKKKRVSFVLCLYIFKSLCKTTMTRFTSHTA